MRIYLDNCCYARPYDSQKILRISLETQAKLKIQELIKRGEIELASSYMLQYECSKNPNEMSRNAIEAFIRSYSTIHIGTERKSSIARRATEIEATGIKSGDAVHVACAIEAGCDYFLTTDDRLLKYQAGEMKIVNPMEFIRLEVSEDEQ